ncbi:MAG TPA: hypothetical protein VGO92_15555, partial [Acidimicrobiales bacterium]|nr:hypothetical protein [Acidimicrobiales bacterium]
EGDDLAGLGLVRDSHNEPLLAVRSDGPTGVHVTDVNGTVICVAGPPEDGGDGLEMMVTRAGAPYRRLLLGLSLAIELLRAGELHLA